MNEEEIEEILNPKDVIKVKVVKTEWDFWDFWWHWLVLGFLFWIAMILSAINEKLGG